MQIQGVLFCVSANFASNAFRDKSLLGGSSHLVSLPQVEYPMYKWVTTKAPQLLTTYEVE